MLSLFSPVHLIVALLPLVAYLLLLGWLNLGRRPFLTTGTRDLGALGLGLIGCVAAGPFELFMPMAAANQFGAFVWLLLLGLYLLSLSLVVLLQRPRLVVYNCSGDQLRPLLADAVGCLDAESRWAGDCLSLPTLGIQLHVGPERGMRIVQLVAVGAVQNYDGWRKIESELRDRLRAARVARNPWGYVFLAVALLLLGAVSAGIAQDPALVARLLGERMHW